MKGFSSPNDTPKPRKHCKDGRFSTSLTGMKSCRVDHGCTPAPKDATKLAVFFRFFRGLSLDISMKNSVQGWSSDFQGLFRVKIRKMTLESNYLSTLPLIIAIHHLHNYGPGTRFGASQARIGCNCVCFSFELSFFFCWMSFSDHCCVPRFSQSRQG